VLARGGVLLAVVMFIFLRKWTDAELWLDAVL